MDATLTVEKGNAKLLFVLQETTNSVKNKVQIIKRINYA